VQKELKKERTAKRILFFFSAGFFVSLRKEKSAFT